MPLHTRIFCRAIRKLRTSAAVAALKIGENLKSAPVRARALSNLGEAFYNLGDLAAAQKHQQLALELWTELGGPVRSQSRANGTRLLLFASGKTASLDSLLSSKA
jgi:hypothetical protein